MSEQPGKAAGTAEPNEPPESINFNKPWHVGAGWKNCIYDAANRFVCAVDLDDDGQAEFAAHIVACVNFCADLDSELLDLMKGGNCRLVCKRIDPVLAAELADNSKQFHADNAGKPVAVMTAGGVI
jgi:hypothetical protein